MKSLLSSVSVSFGVIMIIVVIGGAIAFAFTDVMIDRLYGNKRIGFICVLLAYGVYRGFRVYQVLKQNKNAE